MSDDYDAIEVLFLGMNELTKAVLLRASAVGIYLLIGAGIFESLEKQGNRAPYSEKKYDIYLQIVKQIYRNLSCFTTTVNNSNLLLLCQGINKTLVLEDEGSGSVSSNSEWSFYSALYFSSSVITTIGK